MPLNLHFFVKIDRHPCGNRPADRPCAPDANDTERVRKKKSEHNAKNQIGKVAAINGFMAPAPRSTPSVTSFADTMK